MKIDLHIHTSERSRCGQRSEEQQIRDAIDAGLDAIVFTDHGLLAPTARLAELNEQYAPFWTIGGVEIQADREDLIVFGFRDDALERDDWTYPELREFVAERGGFISIAHPFRYHDGLLLDVANVKPDGIELHSCSTPLEEEERIRALGDDLGIPLLSDSDSHREGLIGKWYNVLPLTPGSEAELIEMLKAGDFERYAAPPDHT